MSYPRTTVADADFDELDVDDMDFPLPEPPLLAPAPPSDIIERTRVAPTLEGMRIVQDASQFKKWICLYPLYFDKSRSVEKGRKVPLALAIDSPHGRQLSVAVKEVGFNVCYEPNKSHPSDFFTPGRVRVQLFSDAGVPLRQDISTRKELMRKVAVQMDKVLVPRDREPSLQDLIDSGAMPMLPGMAPQSPTRAEESFAESPAPGPSSSKAAKKAAGKAKKKGKAKNLV
ncbi:signal recognition particle subunit [Coemansia thaxteri]|uniref:Signal recognition particle subunit n=1 Tax=Coemansia thaxteri TaxID=2663907 RepID=A0A9W8BIE9_9FUNG|nr:signal recognition particle subunit [Coemansia thaxteri]KAJ2002201.1 signal recognition particle subunit [Coemansia thaxteri]KAJ2461915.1 signal recognition particle subunit [Coemansia sp. RSA 2322]KAJ2482302.1 signal recognition particle subunit [Coemansia sp. RSA 2320]